MNVLELTMKKATEVAELLKGREIKDFSLTISEEGLEPITLSFIINDSRRIKIKINQMEGGTGYYKPAEYRNILNIENEFNGEIEKLKTYLNSREEIINLEKEIEKRRNEIVELERKLYSIDNYGEAVEE